MKRIALAVIAVSLTACSTMMKPSPEKLATLPVVTYPDKPATGSDYVYKLPAGQPLGMRLRAEGNVFIENSEQMAYARLKKDLYLYRQWASDDGKTWHDGRKMLDVHLAINIPSHESPGPGDILLQVNRQVAE